MTSGLRGWMLDHPRAVDAVLALVVFVLSLVAVPATPDTVGVQAPRLTPLVVATLLIGCVALFWRRTHPVLVWAVTLAAALAPLPTGSAGRGLPTAVAALYAVAAYGSRRAAVLAAAITMGTVVVLLSRSTVVSATDPVSYAVVAWCALSAVLGDAVRSNRAVLAAALERAQRAEQTREQEADRRVTEERLRISRELHDVVAHHLAVVNIQTGVAEHLAATDPASTQQALGRARAASGQALREMGALVGLLRSDSTDDSGAPAPPAPGAGDLAELVDAARSAGLEVTWRHDGPPLGGTPGADLHLYRVVQEALTNAARHGTGSALLHTSQGEDRAVVEVVNEVAAPGPRGADHGSSGSGHGVVGMRERMALVGGHLEVGPTADGRFRLRAELPREQAP